jgi:hypothetical protein
MKSTMKGLLAASAVFFVMSTAQADELGLSVPDTSIYYYNPVSSKTGYRFGATLGSPTTIYAMYRSRLGDSRELFWEIGLSGDDAGVDVPISLGYRFKLDKRLAIEPILSIYPVNSNTSFGVNIGYRL